MSNRIAHIAQPLFELADAGIIELPTDIAELRTALVAIRGRQAEITGPTAATAQQVAVETLIAAGRAGRKLPRVGGTIVKAIAADSATDAEVRALIDAEALVETSLGSTLSHSATDIMNDQLAPAFAAAVAPLTEDVATTMRSYDPESLIQAPTDVRDTYAAGDRAVAGALAIRGAASIRPIRDGLGTCELDDGRQALTPDRINPAWLRTHGPASTRLPASVKDQMIFLAANGCRLWLPTPRQRDAAFGRYHRVMA